MSVEEKVTHADRAYYQKREKKIYKSAVNEYRRSNVPEHKNAQRTEREYFGKKAFEVGGLWTFEFRALFSAHRHFALAKLKHARVLAIHKNTSRQQNEHKQNYSDNRPSTLMFSEHSKKQRSHHGVNEKIHGKDVKKECAYV